MEIKLKFDHEVYTKSDKVPQCVISDFNLGTMRFKWDEDNQGRKKYFSNLYPEKKVIDIELGKNPITRATIQGNKIANQPIIHLNLLVFISISNPPKNFL